MPGQATVTIGESVWSCSVASTSEELTNGLSNIPSIVAGDGMLFDLGGVYGSLLIDMASMLFPLDIIFIDVNGLVNSVAHDVQPLDTDITGTNARYFMEVNAGEAVDIEVGDSVSIEGYPPEEEEEEGTTITQMMELLIAVTIMGVMMGAMLSDS